jgi:hypothetical protein
MLTFLETVLMVFFTVTILPSFIFIGLIIVDDLITKVHKWQKLK